MITSICRSLSVSFLVLVALTCSLASAAQAQESPIDLLQELGGLDSAFARRYTAASELSHLPVATPDLEATSSATGVEVTVLEFDGTANALLAFTMLNEEMARAILGDSTAELSEARPVDLGDESQLYLGEDTHGNIVGLLAIRDGNLGYLITAEGSDETITTPLRDIGTFMVDAELGSDEVVIGGLADSSGGTWDLMPGADDTEVLGDLIPMYDYDLLIGPSPLEAGATPAS